MAMQTNLSTKDKLTITIVLYCGILFMVIWFLIKPTFTSIMNTNEKINQARLTQDQYRNKVIYLTSGEAIYSKAVADLNESTKDFYMIMDSSEIDKMVTSYVLKSGLFSESLTINMPKGPVEETPYIYSSTADASSTTTSTSTSDTKLGDLLSPYNSARNGSKSTQASGVQCVRLTLVVTGSRTSCQAFIDDVSSKPAVRVTGFSWEKVDKIEVVNEETGIVELKDSGKSRLRIDLNLYMADVADYEASVTDAVNAVANSEG